MQEEHFGKLLAKISGINLDELNASVESSKKKQISERMQFSLDNDLLYIKNQYEYFEDTPTHYINQNPVKHGEYNEKIASYLTLKMLEKQPDLLLAIGELEDYFEYDKEIEQFLFENNYIESLEYGDRFWDHVHEINTYRVLENSCLKLA